METLLKKGLAELGLDCSGTPPLLRYGELLLETNKVMNLTWIGVVYMVILVAMMTYYYFTGSMLVNMAPLLAVPGLIGLGILALVSWRTTGRPGKWPAIALAAVCFLAALATLPLGIVGLLSNFSLVGVFVTGAP